MVLTFEYNDSEWENIPVIIPKFLTTISKQFNTIIRWQENKDRQETATEVKEKLNKIIEENRYSIQQLQSWSEN